MATGWDLTPALLAAIPEALAPASRAASARRHAPAPDRRVPRAVGRPRRDRVRGRASGSARWSTATGCGRPSFAVTRDRLVAVASEAGAVPFAAAETVRRGRLGPGELLLVEPGRRAILEDAEAKACVLRDAADPRRATADPRGPVRDGRAPRCPRGRADSTPLRYLAGLDAERARLDIKTMALEGHEPLWSMGDDTPTPGRGRLDRPVADHLRQAFAQVTNPAIDPERERVVMDLRVELGRRPGAAGRPAARPADAAARSGRSSPTCDGLLDAVARRAAGGPRRSTRPGRAPTARPGSRRPSTGWPREAVRRRRGRRRGRSSSRTDGFDARPAADPVDPGRRAPSTRRSPTPACAAGPTSSVDAADVLDVHAMAMVLAVGATAVHPRLAIELAAELAGTRGAEELTPADAIGNLVDRVRGRPAQDARPDGHQRGRVVHRRGAHRRRRPRRARSSRAASRRPPRGPGRTTFADLAARQLRRREAAPAPSPGRRPAASRGCPDPGLRPVPRRRRGAPVLAEDRGRDHHARSADRRSAGRHRRRARALPGGRSPAAPADRAVPRDELRDPPRRASPSPLAEVEDAREHRPPLRRVGDERRRAVARGAPGADDRHPARRRRREHRRGRRGSRRGTRPDRMAGATTPGSSRSPRPGSA